MRDASARTPMGGIMMSTGTLIPLPLLSRDRPRPGSLGATWVVAALTIACGGGGEPARGAAEGSAAPAGQAIPAEARVSSPGRSDPVEAEAARAAELYDSGRSADAERAYREILQQHPEHVGSLVGLAQILLDREDLDGAGAVVERALK